MTFKAFLIYWKAKLFGTTISKHDAAMQSIETNWEQQICERLDVFFLNLTDIGDILTQMRYELFSVIGKAVDKFNEWYKQLWIYRFTH